MIRFVFLLFFTLGAYRALKGRARYLVPHTHLDLGWLQTIGGYYNSNVRQIITQVVEQLLAELERSPNPRSRFVFAEVGYFKIWLNDQPALYEQKVAKLKKLAAAGLQEWVGGGISQADEAVTHFDDLIGNYFYGLRFLNRVLGLMPSAAWQLDPFGHSTTFAYISRLFGFQHLVITRIPSEDRLRRVATQALQFKWNLPDNLSIITHVLPKYSPIASLACEYNCKYVRFSPVDLAQQLDEWEQGYRGDTFMLIGDDFQWMEPEGRFAYIHDMVQKSPQLEFRVALFSEYIRAFENSQLKELPQYSGDFLVYNDLADYKFWSGFYTSKSRLKRKIREVGKLLRSLRAALVQQTPTVLDPQTVKDVIDLSEDVAIFMHHDAITGTSVEHCDDDYLARIQAITEKANQKLQTLLKLNLSLCDFNDASIGLTTCNVELTLEKPLLLRVYNPAPTPVQRLIEVVVVSKLQYLEYILVVGEQQQRFLKGDIFCNLQSICVIYFKDRLEAQTQTIYQIKASNVAEVKAHGGVSYSSTQRVWGDAQKQELGTPIKFADYSLTVYPDYIEYYQVAGGKLVLNKIFISFVPSQGGGHYTTDYTFVKHLRPFDNFLYFYKLEGDVCDVVEFQGQNLRLRFVKERGATVYKLQTTINNSDEVNSGIELQLVIETNLDFQNKFRTDANGLFDVERQATEGVEKSIFPITSHVEAYDERFGQGLRVYTDRAQGALVTRSKVAVWLHRSTSANDNKGNYQLLIAREPIITSHWVLNFAGLPDEQTHVDILNNLLYSFLEAVSSDPLWPFPSPKPAKLNIKNIKVDVDFMDETTFLVRLQNQMKTQNTIADVLAYFQLNYPAYACEEVEFDFVRRIDKVPLQRKAAANRTVFKPLEFKTYKLVPK